MNCATMHGSTNIKFHIHVKQKAKMQLKCTGNLSEDVFNANSVDVQTFRKKLINSTDKIISAFRT